MVPTTPSPKPYVPRSHPAFFRCRGCRCLVPVATHEPFSVECGVARDERLDSIRADD